ncbi:zinc ribbon domain-containing protein [Streptomyces sp. NPDC058525]|uniref:zinc ribbon domain-containing protein n=1 Tax=Streptomyces sp. NPDC058525 TaxID=3346538 RepID=UPI0036656C85
MGLAWSGGNDAMRCGACGYENLPGAIYCQGCQGPLTRPCPTCGEPMAANAQSCTVCGAAIGPARYPAGSPPHRDPPPGRPGHGSSPPPTRHGDPPHRTGSGMQYGQPPNGSRAEHTAPDSHSLPHRDDPARWSTGSPHGTDSTGSTHGTDGIQQEQPKKGSRGEYTGEVTAFRSQREQWGNSGSEEVWHFRLTRHDADGNALQPVPVEMRALSFSGSVSNGDQVRISGRWRDGTLRADELRNLTTHARVHNKAYRGQLTVARVLVVLIALAVLIGIASIVISGISGGGGGPPPDWPPEPTPPDWWTPPP